MGQTFSLILTFLRVQLFSNLPDTNADLTGRTYIITGSNTGLGLALALHLARLRLPPAQLILAVRDLKKGDAAKECIITQTAFKGAIEVWELDMASFASVVKFAECANTTLKRLDGAVLNAGINTWEWGVTADGWERILQINALSTGLLGVLLLPLLQATSTLLDSKPELPPHLTITGSEGMFLAKFSEKSASASKILATMNDKAQCKDIVDRYPTSKLFNLFLAREIAKLPLAQGVVVNVVSPGLCASEIGRDLGLSRSVSYLIGCISWTAAKGALNLKYGMLQLTPSGAPPAWTQSKEGLRVQAEVWAEMMEVWRGVCPEVADIVSSV
ncbi:hypothetical protein K438DRAFT_1760943 [Mycena galopus ATCC 62051]|nr:hypothetical protein K438DRAFT_1760943 [Mycena galopus ATCC 62051]